MEILSEKAIAMVIESVDGDGFPYFVAANGDGEVTTTEYQWGTLDKAIQFAEGVAYAQGYGLRIAWIQTANSGVWSAFKVTCVMETSRAIRAAEFITHTEFKESAFKGYK